jgi:hypothetical protein
LNGHRGTRFKAMALERISSMILKQPCHPPQGDEHDRSDPL